MMKVTNNFDLISRHMNICNADEFYFVQILVRGKDGHKGPGINGNNKNRLIKYYTIKSVEQLKQLEPEIITICDALNARAYIHPTKRSFKEVAKETLHQTTEMFLSENIVGLKGSYSTACGKSYITSDKKYVVDLDGEDVKKAFQIVEFIVDNCRPLEEFKFQYSVPTVNGVHLIFNAFDVATFSKEFPGIDVHKNNPTLLYYKKVE